jgi:periplasmic divalent cation tolerance protein
MTTNAVMIMTTVKDNEHAKEMAMHLIGGKFAACIQELPIKSHFNWDGKTNSEPEVLLLIKTAADRAEAVVEAIKAKHSYDVPEILISPIIGGFGPYLKWIQDETRNGAT